MKYIKEKTQVTLIHTILSLVAFSVVLFFMLTQWFPSPLFSVEGGWQALRIILFVDIVLGPCLTFFVFSPEKSPKETCIDLGTVALIQIAALSYGVNTAYSNRVVAISYLEHKQAAYPVRGDQIAMQALNDSNIQSIDPQNTPALVFSQRPKEGNFEAITESAKKVAWGIQEYAQPELMTPLKDHLHSFVSVDSTFRIPYQGSFSEGILIISSKGKILDFIATSKN